MQILFWCGSEIDNQPCQILSRVVCPIFRTSFKMKTSVQLQNSLNVKLSETLVVS